MVSEETDQLPLARHGTRLVNHAHPANAQPPERMQVALQLLQVAFVFG
jgi:hypothetical protein